MQRLMLHKVLRVSNDKCQVLNKSLTASSQVPLNNKGHKECKSRNIKSRIVKLQLDMQARHSHCHHKCIAVADACTESVQERPCQ